MLHKPQVVSESMYFMASGDATLHCLSDKGEKPLESLFETVLRAAGVVEPSVVHCLLHIFVQYTGSKDAIKNPSLSA